MSNRVIFLDRDGVINQYPGHGQYVVRLRDFKMLTGSAQAIAHLYRADYKIYVVSNQGGVAKGLYTRKTLKAMTDRMKRAVFKYGGRIHRVLYCLHTKDMDCACRKPRVGLLKTATQGRRIDRRHSYFIGDSLMDVKAGQAFGCKTILVLSGREKMKNAPDWNAAPDFIAKNLKQATRNILTHKYDRA
ncbi:MAG: HAD-IIIA family hydrolase [Candidatus Omnitrophota bacterium]